MGPRGCIAVIADSYHFKEDPDLHYRERLDPDLAPATLNLTQLRCTNCTYVRTYICKK